MLEALIATASAPPPPKKFAFSAVPLRLARSTPVVNCAQ
jgi:hypothetical protein